MTVGPAEEMTYAVDAFSKEYIFQLGTPAEIVAGRQYTMDLSYTLDRGAVLAVMGEYGFYYQGGMPNIRSLRANAGPLARALLCPCLPVQSALPD